MARKRVPPIHPGEVLREEFLIPLGLTQYRLAKGLKVPPRRINEIVHGTRAVSADTALRLARFFGTSDRFWLNLQAAYDLDVERDRLGGSVTARGAGVPKGKLRTLRPGLARQRTRYHLEGDPRFLRRVEEARKGIRAGRGVRIEVLSTKR